ncbi:response regulator, partial [Natronomonas sp. CBA1123]|nr:response regulator [Natronomonas sp. CBA1123]
MTGTQGARVLTVSGSADGPTAAIEGEGSFAVLTATDAAGALTRLEEADCVVVVDDADLDAVGVLEAVRERDTDVPVVVVADDETVASRAVAAGVDEFVPKTTSDAERRLLERLRAALEGAAAAPDRRRRPDAHRKPRRPRGTPAEGASHRRGAGRRRPSPTPTAQTTPMVYINDAFERLTGYSERAR